MKRALITTIVVLAAAGAAAGAPPPDDMVKSPPDTIRKKCPEAKIEVLPADAKPSAKHATPDAAAPATIQAASPLLWIRVVFYGPEMPRGDRTVVMVRGVEASAALESHVTSLEIINSEQAEAETGEGRRYTYTQYFIRLNLDTAGTAEANKMIKIAKEPDKRDHSHEGRSWVMLNDNEETDLHLIPHNDGKTGELRLVVTDEQLLALSAAVKRVWKRPHFNQDWTEGKIPTDPTP